ncbi:uncharacterized protein LOC113763417 [Coffea eugenioides]|uniref:uncharacterized protein LOC113763417 n=1 Tax=Coffea eugenioides TaxID=49369 RepID=UPI000F60F107|nr:uncharacterized protein LOC113763417 [Coffea eugenioides]
MKNEQNQREEQYGAWMRVGNIMASPLRTSTPLEGSIIGRVDAQKQQGSMIQEGGGVREKKSRTEISIEYRGGDMRKGEKSKEQKEENNTKKDEGKNKKIEGVEREEGASGCKEGEDMSVTKGGIEKRHQQVDENKKELVIVQVMDTDECEQESELSNNEG